MPGFSANISTLFREYALTERVDRAALAGFDAIEVQFPYGDDPIQLRAALDRSDLPLALMNFPAGDLLSGGEGLAGIPGRERDFDTALAAAREFAALLRPRAMNLLAGRPSVQRAGDHCYSLLQSQLLAAAEVADELGFRLLVEAVNPTDLPGFLLDSIERAMAMIDALPQIELQLQYDCYHAAMMGEDPLKQLPPIIQRIGHIQFSDLPGRTEPGLGRLDFDAIFALIDQLGYAGFVGAEYFPTVATEDTFAWLDRQRLPVRE